MTPTEQLFKILNMSSNPADLLPQARIRLAALELFGQQGFDKTTIRQIATRAGVSPGLVIHHYGSKNQLRSAVDDWLIEFMASEKAMTLASPMMPAMGSYLESIPEVDAMLAYIYRTLREGGPATDQVFDRMCDLTAEIIEMTQAQGIPVDLGADPKAMITLLVASSLGLVMLSDQLARNLGGNSLTDLPVMRRYAMAAMQLYTNGIFVDDTLLNSVTASFAETDKEEHEEQCEPRQSKFATSPNDSDASPPSITSP